MRTTGASAIDELRAGFDEPFSALGNDAPRDRGTVVISWPSVPVELVRAAGFAPVVARGSGAPTPAADQVLEPDLFPNRLRQLVEAALTGRLAEVAAIVLPRTSDPDYKCFLYLRELVRSGAIATLPPVLLFDLLRSDGADTQAHNAERTRALWAQLARLVGGRPQPENLRRQDRANSISSLLQSVFLNQTFRRLGEFLDNRPPARTHQAKRFCHRQNILKLTFPVFL